MLHTTHSKAQEPMIAQETASAGEGAEPTPPLSAKQIFNYSLANLGYGAFFALNNAVLPLFLRNYTSDARLIGLMGSSHSIEGAVIQPLVGAASDRLRSPLGRRRPFLLVFIPLSALFLVLTPFASHLPLPVRLAAILGSIFFFTVLFNVAQDPYQALMPDITPVWQRGRVMALVTLFNVVGQAGLMLLPTSVVPLPGKFGLTALVMLLTTLLTCALIREPKRPLSESPPKGSHYGEVKIALEGLKTLRQAGKALVSMFLSGVGIGAVFPFLTLFVKDITHCTDDAAQHMFLVLMLATAIGVVPFGWLADRLGAKRVLLLGLSLIAVAALGGLWVTTLPQITAILFLAGLGNAAQSAARYPLLTQLVPREEVGFYTGLQSTALSLALPLTSVFTGALVNHGSYRVIFLVCSVSVALAALVLTQVWQQKAKTEVGVRDRQQGRAGNAPAAVIVG